MKLPYAKSTICRSVLALVPALLFPSCERQEEVAKLRAENAALKSEASLNREREAESKRAILAALRKMKVATETGVSLSSYSDFLIAAVVEIEPHLAEISEGPFKDNAASSLQAFKDAKDFWKDYAELSALGARMGVPITVFTDDKKARVEKYPMVWLKPNREIDLNDSCLDETAFKTNISSIWKKGEQLMLLAEDAAK